MTNEQLEVLTIHAGMMMEGLSSEEALACIITMQYSKEVITFLLEQITAQAFDDGYDKGIDDSEEGGINYI